jgi:magnesium-transporting ATPase (P-type)
MSQTSSPSPSNTALSVSDPYALQAAEVLDTLRGNREGLTTAEAADRLKAVGPNRLPEPPKEGLLKRFFKHFNDILIYILIAAGVVKAFLGDWVDAFVILAVAVINTIVGFVQEGKAEEALEGIRKMLSLRAHTRREGEWIELDAADLVPGDIVRVTVCQPTFGSLRRSTFASKNPLLRGNPCPPIKAQRRWMPKLESATGDAWLIPAH